MRDAYINQTKIYYSLLVDSEEADKYGNKKKVYTEPREWRISISPGAGKQSGASEYGFNVDYDKEMVTYNKNCPFDEYTILWIDGIPITEEANGRIIKVARTNNSIRYAVKMGNVKKYSDRYQ